VIVAAGPWSSSLLDPIGVSLPVSGARGWIVRVAPRPGLLTHLVEQAGWRAAPGRQQAVARPTASDVAGTGMPGAEVGALLHVHQDGTVLVGSSRQAWITPEPEDPTVPRRQLQAAIRLVPSLADAPVLSSWWGLRPVTPDERPLVGRIRDGLIVAIGHGSEGVILGAGTANLVASIVDGGEPPFDPTPFDPLRFG
jgi:D-amino-acid dehydrogenase